MGLQITLFQAFYAEDLQTPPGVVLDAWEKNLDPDPKRRFEQTMYLVGLAVNKLRNARGTGHGRPFVTTLTAREARVAVEAMGLVAEMLLDRK